MKKILNRIAGALALIVCLAAIAVAQGSGRIDGEVFDPDGKPFSDVNITLKNKDTGQTLTGKTDKNGKFSILGLRTAIYDVTLSEAKTKLNFQDQIQVQEQGDNHKTWNFKDLIAQQKTVNPEAEKAKAEEQKKFEGLKAHFTAGVAAMTDAKAVKTQLQAAPTDQSLKDKLDADYQTAITEFKAAEQAAGPKDIANHALVWANLGSARRSDGAVCGSRCGVRSGERVEACGELLRRGSNGHGEVGQGGGCRAIVREGGCDRPHHNGDVLEEPRYRADEYRKHEGSDSGAAEGDGGRSEGRARMVSAGEFAGGDD